LFHILANSNRQNFLYYHARPLFEGCQSKEETFKHVKICDTPTTVLYRQDQLQLLHQTLGDIQMSEKVTQTIMQWLSILCGYVADGSLP
jgi:hypothetical protein